MPSPQRLHRRMLNSLKSQEEKKERNEMRTRWNVFAKERKKEREETDFVDYSERARRLKKETTKTTAVVFFCGKLASNIAEHMLLLFERSRAINFCCCWLKKEGPGKK